LREADRRHFYQQLLWVVRQRGHNIRWAFHKVQEKFGGAKPPWSWKSLPPVEPELHVLSWVRSRQM
jgi:hypothetical protein